MSDAYRAYRRFIIEKASRQFKSRHRVSGASSVKDLQKLARADNKERVTKLNVSISKMKQSLRDGMIGSGGLDALQKYHRLSEIMREDDTYRAERKAAMLNRINTGTNGLSSNAHVIPLRGPADLNRIGDSRYKGVPNVYTPQLKENTKVYREKRTRRLLDSLYDRKRSYRLKTIMRYHNAVLMSSGKNWKNSSANAMFEGDLWGLWSICVTDDREGQKFWSPYSPWLHIYPITNWQGAHDPWAEGAVTYQTSPNPEAYGSQQLPTNPDGIA